MQNTYWNHAGKFQAIYDEVSELIPTAGECPEDKPALETLRQAANLYYDLHNNGLCNYEERDFRDIFGCSSVGEKTIEEKLDSFIVAAALENGYVLTKKAEI